MPAYINIEDLAGEIPQEFLTQALDDNSDGVADDGAWAAIAAAASEDVDALLSGRYATPFSAPIPALVKRATRVFSLEKLYLKRGVSGDRNPWTKQADDLRALLQKIALGEAALDIEIVRGKPSATIITEKSRTHSSEGKLIC